MHVETKQTRIQASLAEFFYLLTMIGLIFADWNTTGNQLLISTCCCLSILVTSILAYRDYRGMLFAAVSGGLAAIVPFCAILVASCVEELIGARTVDPEIGDLPISIVFIGVVMLLACCGSVVGVSTWFVVRVGLRCGFQKNFVLLILVLSFIGFKFAIREYVRDSPLLAPSPALAAQ